MVSRVMVGVRLVDGWVLVEVVDRDIFRFCVVW